jgi:hypothetical protein
MTARGRLLLIVKLYVTVAFCTLGRVGLTGANRTSRRTSGHRWWWRRRVVRSFPRDAVGARVVVALTRRRALDLAGPALPATAGHQTTGASNWKQPPFAI